MSDFGLTKEAGGASTQTGHIVGTLDYLAPEQIRGEEIDGRTDEYALACLLYECLSGATPFARPTEAEVLWAHMQEDAADPARLRGARSGARQGPRQGQGRAVSVMRRASRCRAYGARPRGACGQTPAGPPRPSPPPGRRRACRGGGNRIRRRAAPAARARLSPRRPRTRWSRSIPIPTSRSRRLRSAAIRPRSRIGEGASGHSNARRPDALAHRPEVEGTEDIQRRHNAHRSCRRRGLGAGSGTAS